MSNQLNQDLHSWKSDCPFQIRYLSRKEFQLGSFSWIPKAIQPLCNTIFCHQLPKVWVLYPLSYFRIGERERKKKIPEKRPILRVFFWDLYPLNRVRPQQSSYSIVVTEKQFYNCCYWFSSTSMIFLTSNSRKKVSGVLFVHIHFMAIYGHNKLE